MRFCVFAGSSAGTRPEYRDAAVELGRTLAERNIGVVYGGSCVGLMGAVADAALAAGGEVIGVIPQALVDKEVAHRGLTDLRIVSSMHERKALMADLSDGFVALPGGFGTIEELFEVLTWAQLRFHAKPCGLLNVAGYFNHLLLFADYAVDQGFVKRENRSMIVTEADTDTLLAAMGRYSPPTIDKWIGREAGR